MNKDNLVIAGIVIALVFSGFALFNGGQDGTDGSNGQDAVGGFPGPEIYQHLYLNSGATLFFF